MKYDLFKLNNWLFNHTLKAISNFNATWWYFVSFQSITLEHSLSEQWRTRSENKRVGPGNAIVTDYRPVNSTTRKGYRTQTAVCIFVLFSCLKLMINYKFYCCFHCCVWEVVVFGACFVVQYMMSFLVLQSSHWGRESGLLYFNCL